MKKKKRLMILMAICLVFTILICFFTLFVPWYNNNYPTFAYEGDDLDIIQMHYIYCELHLFYYYISFNSDQQALDPGSW